MPWGGGRRAWTLEARGCRGHPAHSELRRGSGVGRPGAGVVPGCVGLRGGARRQSGSRRPGQPRGAPLAAGPRRQAARRRRSRGRLA